VLQLRVLVTRSDAIFISSTHIINVNHVEEKPSDDSFLSKFLHLFEEGEHDEDEGDHDEHGDEHGDAHEDGSDHEGLVSMSEFEDTFNVIIGSTNKEINLFNNPYMVIKVYDIDQNFTPTPSRKIKLKNCENEDLLSFMPEKAASYYPNALCFDDKTKINLLANWFENEFQNMMIVVERCQNSSSNKNFCKTEDEID
jgi:ABC-type Zn2+ transport system substrate-binding protein/surface adhesin